MSRKRNRVQDHVLSVKVDSLTGGNMLIYPDYRDKPTEDDLREGVIIKYGILERMAIAAWLQKAINKALKEARKPK